jgi:hypothetical protein
VGGSSSASVPLPIIHYRQQGNMTSLYDYIAITRSKMVGQIFIKFDVNGILLEAFPK